MYACPEPVLATIGVLLQNGGFPYRGVDDHVQLVVIACEKNAAVVKVSPEPVLANDRFFREENDGVKLGGVCRTAANGEAAAVHADHAAVVVHQPHVGLVERRVVVIDEQRTLAEERVVRREQGRQLRVLDLYMTLFFECFPCVCPEPVLAKRSFLV
jgi:hypothetical protein